MASYVYMVCLQYRVTIEIQEYIARQRTWCDSCLLFRGNADDCSSSTMRCEYHHLGEMDLILVSLNGVIAP